MKHSYLLGAAVLLLACNSSKKATHTDAGYTSLFDGKTLNGWRTYQNKAADSWMVQNGMLYCKGSATDKSDKRADLITVDTFENFDLQLDWKLAPQGNSGILYMVTETQPSSYLTGPEYQLIDDVNFPEKLEDWQKTAANYAMNTAPNAHPKPAGQWNHTRIVVNNGHVEHWLNSEKVVEYDLWTEDWKKRKAEGKWKDAPEYGMLRTGHIALQDHGSEAWFKNLEIRRL
jgi:hypothetical protein